MKQQVMKLNNHNCNQEPRIAHIEAELAELKARMDNKKEDIQVINKELVTDRQQQLELIEKVTEVTVLLKAQQEQRESSNKLANQKFKALEDKIDELSKELVDTKEQLTDFAGSQRSFRNTMLAMITVISIIIGVVLHFI